MKDREQGRAALSAEGGGYVTTHDDEEAEDGRRDRRLLHEVQARPRPTGSSRWSGDAVKKVECKTCNSHHLYRRPKTERDAAHARMAKRAEDRKAAGGGARPRRRERRTPSRSAPSASRRRAWEHAIAGQPSARLQGLPHHAGCSGTGELIRHPKFGDGVVARVIDRGKVEILFKDGPRTMAHGQA